MSKECKVARNVVVLTFILVFSMLILLMSSCSTTSYSCPAYASVEQTK